MRKKEERFRRKIEILALDMKLEIPVTYEVKMFRDKWRF